MAITRRAFSGEELRLLDAVHAEPKNAAPRMVCADWLDERDDPLGEFIRIQIAHKFGFAYGHEDRMPPRHRDLAKLHKWTWLRALPRYLRPRFCIRGLLRLQFKVDVSQPAARTEQLSRLERLSTEDLDATLETVNPRVRFAMVCCETAALAGLLQHRFFARVDTLGVVVGPMRERSTGSRFVTPEAVTAVAGCPYLRNFEKVQFAINEVVRSASDEFQQALHDRLWSVTFMSVENEVDL